MRLTKLAATLRRDAMSQRSPEGLRLSPLPLHLSVGHVKPSRSLMSLRRWLRWVTALTVSSLLSAPLCVAQEPPKDEDVTLEQVSYDLFTSAQSGHIHQVGPTITPNAPGWEYLTRKGLGQWRRPSLSSSGRWVSFVEGRGGHIDFPITEEDEGLDQLSIWLEPATSRQILSLFLDEELISNLSLQRRPKLYRLKLPRPLKAGEHRLRLWFRSSRAAPWGGRTAGAVGPIQFTPKGAPHTAPVQWTGDVLVDQQRWGALFAPPPTSWRFYLTPPHHATLDVGAWVGQGPSTHFEVRVARDGEPDQVLSELSLEPNRHTLLKVSLERFAHTPIRLTLRATPRLQGEPQAPQRLTRRAKSADAKSPKPQVGWLSPKISGRHPNPRSLASVQLVLVWVIDGLNQDTLALIKTHQSQLPTLARFMSQSFLLPELWSGAGEPSDGHRALLLPEETPSLTQLLSSEGVTSSLITLDHPLTQKIMRSFDHVYEVTQEGVAGHIEGLKHLEEHLTLERAERPNGRHLVYLTSSELRTNSRIKHGFRLLQPNVVDRGSSHILNQLALIDYQLMMLMSELSALKLMRDSMVLMVGAPSPQSYLNNRAALSGAGRALKSLEVSALLWHPKHLGADFTLRGGHLSALSATIAQTLMHGEPSALPFDPLSAHLLNRAQLPPQAERAIIGGSTVTRLGEYVLYEVLNQPPSLRRVHQDGGEELSTTHPVTLRALKDALSSARLNEGL